MTLCLKPNATKEEIKQVYKDLLTVWNPDKFSNEPSLQQKAREKVKEIDEAYEKLIIYLLKSSERPSQSEFKENDNTRGSQFYTQSSDTYKAQEMSQSEKNTTQAPEEESNFSYTQSSQLSSPTATLTDGDYAAFVGKNADKYISKFKKFNRGGTDNFVATWHWPAFFAGFWWMLYRKLYLWALLYFVLLLIPYVDVVACIAFAITSNYIYYKHSKNKVLEIKQAQQSPRMQRDVAVRTGGVNSWIVTVMVTVVAGVAVISILAAIVIPAYLGKQERAKRRALIKADESAASEVSYYNRGLYNYSLSNYHLAIGDFDRAIGLNPQDYKAYLFRGMSYANLSNYQLAIRDYERAIELNSQDYIAYHSRGLSYVHLSNYQQAIRDFDRAIELNPQDSAAYYARGLSYANLGNHEQYVIDCIKAARLGNKDAQDSLSSRGIVWQRD